MKPTKESKRFIKILKTVWVEEKYGDQNESSNLDKKEKNKQCQYCKRKMEKLTFAMDELAVITNGESVVDDDDENEDADEQSSEDDDSDATDESDSDSNESFDDDVSDSNNKSKSSKKVKATSSKTKSSEGINITEGMVKNKRGCSNNSKAEERKDGFVYLETSDGSVTTKVGSVFIAEKTAAIKNLTTRYQTSLANPQFRLIRVEKATKKELLELEKIAQKSLSLINVENSPIPGLFFHTSFDDY